MKFTAVLFGLLFAIPSIAAHSGLYHNYAGSGTGFLILLAILIIGLILYEKIGDNALGYSILWIAMLIPLYIDLFYPQNDEITQGMFIGGTVIVIGVFGFNYIKKWLKRK